MKNKQEDNEAESKHHTEIVTINDAPPRPHEETKTAGDALQLLPFPPEIRLMIYNLVLDLSNDEPRDPKLPRELTIRPKRSSTSKDFNLSVLLVSKQTYMETYHIFYRINHLCFETTTTLFQFLHHIGSPRRQQIVSVSFNNFDHNAKRAFRLLKTCQRLKHVRLILPLHQPPGYVALREVRGLESVYVYLHEYLTHRGIPRSDPNELKKAMMRPRLKQYEIDPEAKIDLFKTCRKILRKTDDENLAIEMKWPPKFGGCHI